MRALLLVLLLTLTAGAQDLAELSEKARPSVALLRLNDGWGKKAGSGTGFMITADRMVTNFHVIGEASGVVAKFSDGREVKVKGVLACSQKDDLAVLQLEGGPYPGLALGDSTKLKLGDWVMAFGSPRGLADTATQGEISALRPKGPELDPDDSEDITSRGAWQIQMTATISPGSSGCPVLDAQGEVVAVAVGESSDDPSINFAVPVALLKELLATIGPEATAVPVGQAVRRESKFNSKLIRNLAISGAFFIVLFFGYRKVSGAF